MKHNAQIKVFAGTAEVVGRVRLLEGDILAPGNFGWAQLTLAEPVVVARGQRFILRRPSPAETIAGGMVVDPAPMRRHRRFQPAVWARLDVLARGTPEELLLQAFERLGPASVAEAAQLAGIESSVAEAELKPLTSASKLIPLTDENLYVARSDWQFVLDSIDEALSTYHALQPLRAGMPREELRSRVTAALPAARRARLTGRVFNAVLAEAERQGHVRPAGTAVARADFEIHFTASQQAAVDALLADFYRDPYNTPSASDCSRRVSDAVLAALIDQRTLVRLSPEVIVLAGTYAEMIERLQAHLKAHGAVTVAQVRDLFGTSRKYVLALLEHLDALGLTRRVGDERVLRN
jgi:selenocysteine-specific elongation factor